MRNIFKLETILYRPTSRGRRGLHVDWANPLTSAASPTQRPLPTSRDARRILPTSPLMRCMYFVDNPLDAPFFVDTFSQRVRVSSLWIGPRLCLQPGRPLKDVDAEGLPAEQCGNKNILCMTAFSSSPFPEFALLTTASLILSFAVPKFTSQKGPSACSSSLSPAVTHAMTTRGCHLRGHVGSSAQTGKRPGRRWHRPCHGLGWRRRRAPAGRSPFRQMTEASVTQHDRGSSDENVRDGGVTGRAHDDVGVARRVEVL